MKGAWSLANSVDKIARAQPDLDKSVGALIHSMNAGSGVAKAYTPTKGRHNSKDSIFRDMLKEIIKGANIVKVYYEKRPESTSIERKKKIPLVERTNGIILFPQSFRT